MLKYTHNRRNQIILSSQQKLNLSATDWLYPNPMNPFIHPGISRLISVIRYALTFIQYLISVFPENHAGIFTGKWGMPPYQLQPIRRQPKNPFLKRSKAPF
jgi:hypothetical protein